MCSLKRASHGVLAFATAYNNAETKFYHARANNIGTEAGGVDKLVLSWPLEIAKIGGAFKWLVMY